MSLFSAPGCTFFVSSFIWRQCFEVPVQVEKLPISGKQCVHLPRQHTKTCDKLQPHSTTTRLELFDRPSFLFVLSVIVSMLSATYLCYLAHSTLKCVMINTMLILIRSSDTDFPGSLPNTVCQYLMVQEQESTACKLLHMLMSWIKRNEKKNDKNCSF